MKIQILIIAMCCIFCSCQKNSDNLPQTELRVQEKSSDLLGLIASKLKPKLKVKAYLHRPIPRRPRDQKVCDCFQCFGICDISIGIGFSSFLSLVDSDTLFTGAELPIIIGKTKMVL